MSKNTQSLLSMQAKLQKEIEDRLPDLCKEILRHKQNLTTENSFFDTLYHKYGKILYGNDARSVIEDKVKTAAMKYVRDNG